MKKFKVKLDARKVFFCSSEKFRLFGIFALSVAWLFLTA